MTFSLERSSLITAWLALVCCTGQTAAQEKTYIVTKTPVDVGMATRGLCVAVDETDPHGIFWWDPGRGGECSTRSSSIMPGDRPSVSHAAGGSIDVRFRLGLISREPDAHIDVALTIDGQTMRGMSGARVPIVRRNDLKIPESCCVPTRQALTRTAAQPGRSVPQASVTTRHRAQ